MSTYVNHLGQPIDIAEQQQRYKRAALPKATRPGKTREEDAEKASEWHGYEIVGIRAAELRKAREKHVETAAAALQAGKPIGDFDEQAWLAKQTPVKALGPKRYELRESAMLAKSILEKDGGWLLLRVRPVMKRET